MANVDIIKNAVAEGMKDLIRERTIDNISVTDICEKTGLNRRNFYRYFHDKYEVVEWIYYHDYILNTEHYEGWTFWDYFPHITEIIYSDRAYYANAFRYTGQNSFRDCVVRYLVRLIREDYLPCFPTEELYEFYIAHMAGMTFDRFVIWLSDENPMPPEAFAKEFQNWYYLSSLATCSVMEKEPGKREKAISFAADEPSRK